MSPDPHPNTNGMPPLARVHTASNVSGAVRSLHNLFAPDAGCTHPFATAVRVRTWTHTVRY